MSERRRWSTTARVRIFLAAEGQCHVCGGRIAVGDRWELSHLVPLELGGPDTEENLRPAHYRCHRDLTARVDVPAIAKAKRRQAAHIGACTPSRRPMPGGRASKWKRTMDGRLVRRDAE